MSRPASFFTGPLGVDVPLPAEGHGFLGSFFGGLGYTYAEGRTQVSDRQTDLGTTYALIQGHYDGGGSYGGVYGANDPTLDDGSGAIPPTQEDYANSNGSIAAVAWTPNYTIAQINAGVADTIYQKMGLYWSNYGFPIMLRMFHEFDLPFVTYTAHGYTPAQFISAWRRAVAQIQAGGGTNVGFWWCPTESLGMTRNEIAARYPGDAWVDWVGTDVYNYGTVQASPLHGGWAQWYELFNYSAPGIFQPSPGWSIFDIVGSGLAVDGTRSLVLPPGLPTQKPFMVGETSSLYDNSDVNRKRDWFTNILASPYGIEQMPNCIGISFFDVDASGAYIGMPQADYDWRVDRDTTVTGVLGSVDANTYSGFITMGSDAYFGGGGPSGPLLYAARAGSLTTSDLYTVDESTGTLTSIGPIGFAVTGLAFDPTDGTLYGSTSNNSSSDPASLITIDPVTGAGTLVGAFVGPAATLADIAFSSSGDLYGLSGTGAELWQVDKTTGICTDLGSTGIFPFGNAMGFDSGDVLYALPRGGQAGGHVYTLDTSTGAATQGAAISGSPGGTRPFPAGKFDADDLFWAWQQVAVGNPHLVTVDVATGAVTDVGAASLDRVDALAWELVVPTPPGTPDHLAFGVQPSDISTGGTITPAVTVRVLDIDGNVVTTATDWITVALLGVGTLSGTLTVQAVAGVATFSDLVVTGGGVYHLTASATGLAGTTSSPFTVFVAGNYDTVNAPFVHVGVADDAIGQDLIEKTTNMRSYSFGNAISGQPGGPINFANLVLGPDGNLWATFTCFQSNRIINGNLSPGPISGAEGGFGPFVSRYDPGTDTWDQVDGPAPDGAVSNWLDFDTSRFAFDAEGGLLGDGGNSRPACVTADDDFWIGFVQGDAYTTLSYDEVSITSFTLDAWVYSSGVWTQHAPTRVDGSKDPSFVLMRASAADLGHPYMAWSETGGGIAVARWNGSAWVVLGGGYATTDGYVDMRLDKDGNPVLLTQSDSTHLEFVSWDGASWNTTLVSLGSFVLDPTYTSFTTFGAAGLGVAMSDPHGAGSELIQVAAGLNSGSDPNAILVFEWNTVTLTAEPLDTIFEDGLFVDDFTFSGSGKLRNGWQLLQPQDGAHTNKCWLVQYPTDFFASALNAELWHYDTKCPVGWKKTVTYGNFPTDDGLLGLEPSQGSLFWMRDGLTFYAIHAAVSSAEYDTDEGIGIMVDNGGGGASVTTGDATADHTSYSRSTQALDLVGAPNTGNYSACDPGNSVGTSFQSGTYDVYVRGRVNGGAGYGDFAFYYPFTTNPAGPCANLSAAPTPLAIGRWLDNGGNWEEKRIATSVTPGSTGLTRYYRTAFGMGGGASSFDIDYIYFCKVGTRDFAPDSLTHSAATIQAGRVKVFKTTICVNCGEGDCLPGAGLYLPPRTVG